MCQKHWQQVQGDSANYTSLLLCLFGGRQVSAWITSRTPLGSDLPWWANWEGITLSQFTLKIVSQKKCAGNLLLKALTQSHPSEDDAITYLMVVFWTFILASPFTYTFNWVKTAKWTDRIYSNLIHLKKGSVRCNKNDKQIELQKPKTETYLYQSLGTS